MSRHDHSLLRLEGGSSPRFETGPDPSAEAVPPDVLVELVEIQRLLEPATAALVATRATDSDLAGIARRLEAMAAVRGDEAAFAAHDVAFHRALISLAGNGTLMNLLDGVFTRGVLGNLPRGVRSTKRRTSSSPSTPPFTPPSRRTTRRSPTRPRSYT